MAWTQADAVLLRRNVRAVFFGELTVPAIDLAGDFATLIDTDDPTEDYAWLGNVPTVREFKGDRVVRDIVTESYSLSDKEWEVTVGIDRKTIEDGKMGQVEMRIRDLAIRAEQHKNRRMTEVINAGDATAGYDGQFFFDTDHPSNKAGAADRSNDLGQSIVLKTRITPAEAEIALATILEHFTTLRDDQDEPMGLSANGITILIHAQQWKGFAVALGMVGAGQFGAAAAAVSGAFNGMFNLVINPYETTEEKVYAFKTDTVMRPFIFQSRLPIDLEDNLGGDMWFKSNKAEFGTRARYEVGYGQWEAGLFLLLATT